jgi:hypothetical protein
MTGGTTRDLARRDVVRDACFVDRMTIGDQLTTLVNDVVVAAVQLHEPTIDVEPTTSHVTPPG